LNLGIDVLIEKIVERKLNSIWTIVPAIVRAVNDDSTYDVQPKYQGAPIIRKVPIVIYRSGDVSIVPKLNEGDVVLLAFSRESLITTLKDRALGVLKRMPKFQIRDAIIIGCLFTLSEAKETPSRPIKITTSKNTIELDENGNIYVDGDITLNCTGTINLGGEGGKGVVLEGTYTDPGGDGHTHKISIGSAKVKAL